MKRYKYLQSRPVGYKNKRNDYPVDRKDVEGLLKNVIYKEGVDEELSESIVEIEETSNFSNGCLVTVKTLEWVAQELESRPEIKTFEQVS